MSHYTWRFLLHLLARILDRWRWKSYVPDRSLEYSFTKKNSNSARGFSGTQTHNNSHFFLEPFQKFWLQLASGLKQRIIQTRLINLAFHSFKFCHFMIILIPLPNLVIFWRHLFSYRRLGAVYSVLLSAIKLSFNSERRREPNHSLIISIPN